MLSWFSEWIGSGAVDGGGWLEPVAAARPSVLGRLSKPSHRSIEATPRRAGLSVLWRA
jgi:hypothetical protein